MPLLVGYLQKDLQLTRLQQHGPRQARALLLAATIDVDETALGEDNTEDDDEAAALAAAAAAAAAAWR